MSSYPETYLIDGSGRSSSSQIRPSLKSSLRKGPRTDDEDSQPRPKKVRVVSPPKDDSDSETEIESQSELDEKVMKNVLEKMQYKLDSEYVHILPRFDSFMEAFNIGFECKSLPLAIKLTFLKVMNLESHWRTRDVEFSIGFVKFSTMQALWTTLIKCCGGDQDVGDLLEILANSIKSIEKEERRESLRKQFDSILLDSSS